MSFEVTLDTVDFDEFDKRYSSLYSNADKNCFYKTIFSSSTHKKASYLFLMTTP